MKHYKLLLITAVILAFTACKKTEEKKDDSNQTPTPKVSTLESLCQTWVLHETYENNTIKTTNGTDKYQFTRQGGFLYLYNGKWENIGSYDFTSKDSSSISVLFMGTSSPTIMKLNQLDDKKLNTEFSYGSKNYLYKYTR